LLSWLGAGSWFGPCGWFGSLFYGDGGAEVDVVLLAVPGLGWGAVSRTIRVLVSRLVGVIGTVDSHRTS
jgi:hypothetical protein